MQRTTNRIGRESEHASRFANGSGSVEKAVEGTLRADVLDGYSRATHTVGVRLTLVA
jgi:hypothetical protein